MSFVDEVKIYIKAGDGGKGCQSFYYNKRTARRYPDGGDGGKGGDVIIRTNPQLWDLTDFKYHKHIKAQNGTHGSSNKKKGKDGIDKIIEVPLGTIVRDAETGLIIRDMNIQEEILVARGGKGGRGNAFTRSESLPPLKGEEKFLSLELRLLAHVGLVGFPNAGKTTLINALCKTRGKVASYPFTTLEPILGVIWDKDRVIKIADIPGLIEEAHKGKGLGERFLRHIQRTSLLIFILGLADADPQPREAYRILKKELKEFDVNFSRKDYFIVANKIDLPEAQEKIKILCKELKNEKIISVSGMKGIGIDKLENEIVKFFLKRNV